MKKTTEREITQIFEIILILVSAAATAMCLLPIMSVHLSDGESCTLFIRGYNLMEFSAWGCVPLLANLLIPVILFGCQKDAAKEKELIILFVGNTVCYINSVNAAREWLYAVGGSLITYYPGMVLLPLGFIIVLVLSQMLEKICELLVHRKCQSVENDGLS